MAAVATLLWRTQLVSSGPSLGSWVLVSVLSLCVVQRAAEELVLPSASERSKEEKQETGRCPKDTSWTRLGTRVLPLDLIPTSFEVACGQQLIAVEGFPPSERTESRSLPRRVWASERLSGGGREEEKSALNCEHDGYFHSRSAAATLHHTDLIFCALFGCYISPPPVQKRAEESLQTKVRRGDAGGAANEAGGGGAARWQPALMAVACFVVTDHQNKPSRCFCSP